MFCKYFHATKKTWQSKHYRFYLITQQQLKLAKTFNEHQDNTQKEITDMKTKVNKIEDFLRTVTFPPPQIIYQPPPYAYIQQSLMQPTIPSTVPSTPFKAPPQQQQQVTKSEQKAPPKEKPIVKKKPKQIVVPVDESMSITVNHFSVVISGEGMDFATDLMDYVFNQQKAECEMVLIEDPITISNPKAVFILIDASQTEKLTIVEERLREVSQEYGII
jgi:hypothetical protein